MISNKISSESITDEIHEETDITSTQNNTGYMNKMPWNPAKRLPAMVTVLWLAIFAKPICKAVREKETNYSRVTKAKGAKEAPKDPWPLSIKMCFLERIFLKIVTRSAYPARLYHSA